MKVTRTELEGVLQIVPETFEDHRGTYVETYNKRDLAAHGIDLDFIQDDLSRSWKNVLRGLHGDPKTWKLVSCPMGRLYLVVVNCQKNPGQFGRWQSFELSDANRVQILIPPNFANGHLILSDEAIFSYKQTEYYNRSGQFSYKWNDPVFNISWPTKNPILSKRDGPETEAAPAP